MDGSFILVNVKVSRSVALNIKRHCHPEWKLVDDSSLEGDKCVVNADTFNECIFATWEFTFDLNVHACLIQLGTSMCYLLLPPYGVRTLLTN